MTQASLSINQEADELVVEVSGRWTISTIGEIDAKLRALTTSSARMVRFNMSGLDHLDTAGAWMIERTRSDFDKAGAQVELESSNAAYMALIDTVAKSAGPLAQPPKSANIIVRELQKIGENVVGFWVEFIDLLGFAGMVISVIVRGIFQPRRLRMTSIVYHLEEVGFNAIPIVCLISFLIGVVLAYQGADQLRKFGAEVFTIDLIAVSVLREIALLLTAIVVAGRSGSAFTAQIGAMKVNEEIDAMRTLGLDPAELLVAPRVIALVIALPALGFIADMMGLLGGAVMSWVVLDISPALFVERLQQGTDVWNFLVGAIKAPCFAVIIAMIGCYEGFKVGGSAASVGQYTTKAVVKSIFMVIIVDAIFSIFFSTIGI